MKHLLLSLALCIGILGSASAQFTTPNGAHSDQILLKMREVDILLQLMPLILTKDQINTKLLPTIEKNRDIFRKELQYEDDELAKLEPMLDEAMANSYDKGAYPPRKITDDVLARTSKLATQRDVFVGIMVSAMDDTLIATLNPGQMKALLGSFDSHFIDPNAKPESITDARRRRFFIQRIFLDPIAYEVLKKLAKTATS